MGEDLDPREAFNPMSFVNVTSSMITLLGVIVLGLTVFHIARKKSTTSVRRTAEWHRDMNSLYSFAYLGAIAILVAFALGYAFD